jgi:hypothetical protein
MRTDLPRDAQEVAVGGKGQVRGAFNKIKQGLDVGGRQHANGAAWPVNHLYMRWQELGYAGSDERVRMATTEFHDADLRILFASNQESVPAASRAANSRWAASAAADSSVLITDKAIPT